MSGKDERPGEDKASVKTDENDSEAETEILGSQKPTPVKANHRRTRSASKSVKMEDREPEENEVEEGSDNSEHPRQLRHRRRIALSGSEDGGKARSASDEPDERKSEDRKPRMRASRAAAEVLMHEQFKKQHELATSTEQDVGVARKRRRSHHSTSSEDEGKPRQPSRQSARTRHAPKASEGEAQSSHPSHPKMKGLDRSGRTILARACADGDNHKVKEILKASTRDIDIADYAGNTPLQFAALDGYIAIVDLLIKYGCDVHTANSDGDSPLIDAVENGHVQVVKRLLDAGVDPRHKNNTGDWAEDRLEKVDDEEDREELRRLLTQAAERNDDPIPTKTFNKATEESGEVSEERRRGDNRLLYVQPSIAKLREGAKKNDMSMVLHCLDSGVKPDNSSLVAAARAGHISVCNLLLAYGSKADPDPEKVSDSTPMLAVIGRGLPDVIELLLSQEFNVDRKTLNGKHYWEISELRKGRGWKKEMQILKKESKIPAIRAAAIEEAARMSNNPLETPTESPVQATGPGFVKREHSPRQSDDGQLSPQVASEVVDEPEHMDVDAQPEPGEPTPKPRTPTPEPRFKPVERDAMPTGLARALTEGEEYPIHSEEAWIKTLGHWNPIFLVTRGEVEPSCTEDTKTELWMPGYQASVFLGHNQLYDIIEKHELETISMNEAHRQEMWNPNMLSVDYNWLDHPDKQYVLQNCPHFVYQVHPSRPNQLVINWARSHKKQCEKWMSLPEDHVFWVKFKDFLKLTNPDTTPRLKDFVFFTSGVSPLPDGEVNEHTAKSQAYMNGEAVEHSINGTAMNLLQQGVSGITVSRTRRNLGNGFTVEITELHDANSGSQPVAHSGSPPRPTITL